MIKDNKAQIGLAITIVLIIMIIMFFIFLIIVYGIPIKTTSNGTHTGYVSAIEDNGIIWKKGVTIYFKTNSQSSQEDSYCLYIDNIDLKDKLYETEENQTKVTITFNDYLINSFLKCNGENAIITGVK